jgi:Ser/Thr protein kinase RdoA (MazF antagonist)
MYDEAILIDEQLQRMKPLLIKAGIWESTVALGERLRDRLSDLALERGVCHLDFTIDNVHLIGWLNWEATHPAP